MEPAEQNRIHTATVRAAEIQPQKTARLIFYDFAFQSFSLILKESIIFLYAWF